MVFDNDLREPEVVVNRLVRDSEEQLPNGLMDSGRLEQIKRLRAMFPDCLISTIEHALQLYEGNVEFAIELLLGNTSARVPIVIQKPSSKVTTKDQASKVIVGAEGLADNDLERAEVHVRFSENFHHSPSPLRPQSEALNTTTNPIEEVQSFVCSKRAIESKSSGTTHEESSKMTNKRAVSIKSESEHLGLLLDQFPLPQANESENERSPVSYHVSHALPATEPDALSKGKETLIEESYEANSTQLYQIFLEQASRIECENMLKDCDNDPERAFDKLNKKYVILDDEVVEIPPPAEHGRHNRRVTGRNNGPATGQVERTESAGAVAHAREGYLENVEVSSSRGQKRRVSINDENAAKRPREASTWDENSEPREENNSSLEPAGEWLQKFYPKGRMVMILLGPKEAVRDTIPERVLYDNSTYFKNILDQQDLPISAETPPQKIIRLPDVSPYSFDLLIQCLVSKGITLQPGLGQSASSDITTLLDLALLSMHLGFAGSAEIIVSKLRAILIYDRGALGSQHIRRAYILAAGHPIRKLFCQAVVRAYMMGKFVQLDEDSDDGYDSDDEQLTPARAAMYRRGFRYKKALNDIPDFRMEVMIAQDEVLNKDFKDIATRASKTKPETIQRYYLDPLNHNKDLWFKM